MKERYEYDAVLHELADNGGAFAGLEEIVGRRVNKKVIGFDSDLRDTENVPLIEDIDEYFEVTCPSCNEKICVSEDILMEGEIECPKCGEHLEFDFSDSDIEYDDSDYE